MKSRKVSSLSGVPWPVVACWTGPSELRRVGPAARPGGDAEMAHTSGWGMAVAA